ncbi:MAG TPA: FxDxF family PEP-CTERM protein [Nitrosospira sp.]|nr:FxDxF family PEP-CTERM protein [Nitrosospira sp.]
MRLAGVTVSPVPEPETYAMLLAGLGLMGMMVRRRKEFIAQ